MIILSNTNGAIIWTPACRSNIDIKPDTLVWSYHRVRQVGPISASSLTHQTDLDTDHDTSI
ncbi:hypothetical protein L484_016066 [Morus notabilis]|uniref:Uncharacterized protein n=1 Tax=Morus notabilis TaxID=981085 RepID=W9SD65_9ROSA|nr:hypothetical protein L484_016066 [Morus notabilis]